MNFKIGKQYIVRVSENGIIPIEEFSDERYFDIEYDSIDFLTDEEKIVIINDLLDKIRAEVEQLRLHKAQFLTNDNKVCIDSQEVLEIIDKYKAESEEGAEDDSKGID